MLEPVRECARNLLRPVYKSFVRLTAYRPQPEAHPLSTPYIIVGLFRAASSLGESARLQYDGFRRLGEDVYAHDISDLFKQSDMPLDSTLRMCESWPENATLIFHLNAPEVPTALRHIGAARLEKRRLVGYWAWELPKLPASWHPYFRFVHEIWTCSDFVSDAIRPHTSKPVKTVHHPLPAPEALKIDGVMPENIRPDQFVVLNLVNADSSLTRKNPFGAIEAFKQAFGQDDSALLVLRVGRLHTGEDRARDIMQAVKGASNIRLIGEILSPQQREGLLQRANAVLALHKAEGLGLVMVEAMARGKPVIATGWSGNMDFMDQHSAMLVPFEMMPVTDPYGIYDFPDQRWAEPDVKAAAAMLQKLKNDAAFSAALGAKAKAHIENLFSLQNFRRQTGIS